MKKRQKQKKRKEKNIWNCIVELVTQRVPLFTLDPFASTPLAISFPSPCAPPVMKNTLSRIS